MDHRHCGWEWIKTGLGTFSQLLELVLLLSSLPFRCCCCRCRHIHTCCRHLHTRRLGSFPVPRIDTMGTEVRTRRILQTDVSKNLAPEIFVVRGQHHRSGNHYFCWHAPKHSTTHTKKRYANPRLLFASILCSQEPKKIPFLDFAGVGSRLTG